MSVAAERVDCLRVELIHAEKRLGEAKATYEAIQTALGTAGMELDAALEHTAGLLAEMREAQFAARHGVWPEDGRSAAERYRDGDVARVERGELTRTRVEGFDR